MKRLGYLGLGALAIGLLAGRELFVKEPVLALPPVAGTWILGRGQTCRKPVPADWKTWRGTGGAHSACRAEYSGSPPVTLTLYYMPDEFAGAFDTAQEWQSQPGKMGFFKGQLFGVAESAEADPATLERFVLALEAKLPDGNEFHR